MIGYSLANLTKGVGFSFSRRTRKFLENASDNLCWVTGEVMFDWVPVVIRAIETPT
jgi:hypothetical protein